MTGFQSVQTISKNVFLFKEINVSSLFSFSIKNLFKKYGWPVIDVTRKSVEETAASIIKIYEIRKNK